MKINRTEGGLYVVLEGPEGGGKTAQIPYVTSGLKLAGYDVVTTREPGGTDIGDQVRSVIMDLRNHRMSPRTEMMLFSASRTQSWDEFIKTALIGGKIVLCDRNYFSTLCHQTGKDGITHEEVMHATRAAFGDDKRALVPDLTLYHWVSVLVGLERKYQYGVDLNRFDEKSVEYHEGVLKKYENLYLTHQDTWVKVNTEELSQKEVQEHNLKVILQKAKEMGLKPTKAVS